MNNNLTNVKMQLLNMIRTNNYNSFIEKFSNYLDLSMNDNISNVDIRLRNKLKKEILFFVKTIIQKGYVNENNKADVFERIIRVTSFIVNIRDTYGLGSEACLGINFNSPEAIDYMRHYVCHELTHSITQMNKFCSKNGGINSNEAYDNGNDVINCFGFLCEVMAEATACDLAGTYYHEKRRAFASPVDIKSDWHTPYNQQYQQLGKEFIETFIFRDSNMTERELFKAITLQTINEEDIGRIIIDTARSINPNSYKKDLYEATNILGNIVGRHVINSDKVTRFREILGKYSSRRKMTITRDLNNASESRTFVFKHKPKHKMVIQRESEKNITLTHNPNRESQNITLTSRRKR